MLIPGRMIKALLLIFRPGPTWDRIVEARRGVFFILMLYVIPLLAVTGAGEGYGLAHWGKWQPALAHRRHYTTNEVVLFEVGQGLLSLVVVFLGAFLLKSIGETFHGRHSFRQAFTAVGYGLGPYFLLRLVDAGSAVSPWVSWGVGILLAINALYYGVPRALEPDPPQAFGLFLMIALLLLLVTGLARFLTAWYLQGEFTRLEEWVSSVAASLPF